MRKLSVGFGFDAHRISEEKNYIILGGIKIPCGFGLQAVSDGDVVLHAISDAVLGAVGLGDIGDYFPPSQGKYKGIDSQEIVKKVKEVIEGKCSLLNIDLTIVADKPPLKEHKRCITESLKKIWEIDRINVKVKSQEGLGMFGEEAIGCFVVVLVSVM